MINVLYFGDLSAGAMGIINRDIKKIIDKDYPEINFELMDWSLAIYLKICQNMSN